jgi:hypothetical protein
VVDISKDRHGIVFVILSRAQSTDDPLGGETWIVGSPDAILRAGINCVFFV